MSATPIAASTRHINKGVTKVVFATTVASVSAPTRANINAGTDLSDEIMELEGWNVESGSVGTPSLGSDFTGNIPGGTSAEDSSLTMYSDIGGADVRDLLPRGTNGFILIMYGGDVAGRPMDVFPVRVGSTPKNTSVDEEAATIKVTFSITSEPSEDVAIPA